MRRVIALWTLASSFEQSSDRKTTLELQASNRGQGGPGRRLRSRTPGHWMAGVCLCAIMLGLVPRSALAQDAGVPPTSATTATTPTGAPPPADAVATPTEMDAGTYAVRLRDLEQRIDALKEQIFRSKARLSLLAETVLGGVVAGAQAVIVHENRMSTSYRLVKAVYALDGARLFSKADEEGSLGEQSEFEIYNGSIVPGEHNVTVNLEYRGHGYGVFSYLKGYRFRVRSSYTFSAPEGKAITIRVVGYEKGGPTAPLEERPAVRYLERIEGTGREEDNAEGAPAASGGGE